MSPLVLLAVVAAWHAAFQVTVTALVYPALLACPAGTFPDAHARHSRRIVPLVGATYAAVVLACGWVLLSGGGAAAGTAVAAQVVALGTTAVVAAPTHGALGRSGPTPVLTRRLRVADAVRTVAACTGLVAALVALR